MHFPLARAGKMPDKGLSATGQRPTGRERKMTNYTATVTHYGSSVDAHREMLAFAETIAHLSPAERWAAREAKKRAMRRAWVRGGKIGACPTTFL